MRKDKKELLRAQSIIESDRMNSWDNFMELLTSDLDKLLKDYFSFSGVPSVKIERVGDGYSVLFSVNSNCIKFFSHIPKQ